jgi:hypothetical protein
MLWYPFIAQNSKAVKHGFPVTCRLNPFPLDVLPGRMQTRRTKNYGEPALNLNKGFARTDNDSENRLTL